MKKREIRITYTEDNHIIQEFSINIGGDDPGEIPDDVKIHLKEVKIEFEQNGSFHESILKLDNTTPSPLLLNQSTKKDDKDLSSTKNTETWELPLGSLNPVKHK